jgi:hypothetical protein
MAFLSTSVAGQTSLDRFLEGPGAVCHVIVPGLGNTNMKQGALLTALLPRGNLKSMQVLVCRYEIL